MQYHVINDISYNVNNTKAVTSSISSTEKAYQNNKLVQSQTVNSSQPLFFHSQGNEKGGFDPIHYLRTNSSESVHYVNKDGQYVNLFIDKNYPQCVDELLNNGIPPVKQFALSIVEDLQNHDGINNITYDITQSSHVEFDYFV